MASEKKLQNRAARIITRSGYEIRSTDLLHKLGWQSLEERWQLARYLNRSYWEERSERPPERASPTAPADTNPRNSATNSYTNHSPRKVGLKKKKEKKRRENSDILARNNMDETNGQDVQGSEVLVQNFRDTVAMLIERMQLISGKGKHVAMDATVQSLFQTVSALHPQLLRLIEEQEERKEKYQGLQEKLGLVREARSSLESMREQHQEKVRQQEMEQDMLRRIQIEQKLELMRQQKAEYLAYQQRLQTERQLALEQQQQQQQQQPQQQQQIHYQNQMYSVPYAAHHVDTSPYSSLNYIPAISSSTLPQVAVQSYAQPSQAPQGTPGVCAPSATQNSEATIPSQYAPHQPAPSPEESCTLRAAEYSAYGNELPPNEQQPSLVLQQQLSLDYQMPSLVSQPPPSYPSQPQQQPPSQVRQEAPLPPQGYAPPSIAQTSTTPPPQYGQVTAPQQQQLSPQYGQSAGHIYPLPGSQVPPPAQSTLQQPQFPGQPQQQPLATQPTGVPHPMEMPSLAGVGPPQGSVRPPPPMQPHVSLPQQVPSYEASQLQAQQPVAHHQPPQQHHPQAPPPPPPPPPPPQQQQQQQQQQHNQQKPQAPPKHHQYPQAPPQHQQQQQQPPPPPQQQQYYQQPPPSQYQQQQQFTLPQEPPPPQYHDSVQSHFQQSRPHPQRQLSDLELISFD